METKHCPKCDKSLSVDEFSKKGTTSCHKCKSCQREYSKQHYQLNKAKHLEKVKRHAQKVTEFLQDLKSNTPCSDCGTKFHFSVMDFDHLDSTTKSFGIGLRGHRSMGQIKTEIEKCELVCANCHRLRTWKRKVELSVRIELT